MHTPDVTDTNNKVNILDEATEQSESLIKYYAFIAGTIGLVILIIILASSINTKSKEFKPLDLSTTTPQGEVKSAVYGPLGSSSATLQKKQTTPTPTNAPTTHPEPTETPTPTQEPSTDNDPEPTETPTPTPTPEPTETPTPTPTPEPTETPTPTPTPI